MQTTTNYKSQAAAEALKSISAGQNIGLGAGACVAHLAAMIAADETLKASLTLTSSSFKTINLMLESNLNVKPPAYFESLDIYFDGCDQFDKNLNALKSGGGIHTTEKLVASMAKEFILLGESEKRVESLDGTFPILIELIPASLHIVIKTLRRLFPEAVLSLRESKDGAVITDYGNYLLDVKFQVFPEDLETLNSTLKMIPGLIDHSLFFKMATKAITADKVGVHHFTQ